MIAFIYSVNTNTIKSHKGGSALNHIEQRKRLCRLLESMKCQPEFAKALGLKDNSIFNNKTTEGQMNGSKTKK